MMAAVRSLFASNRRPVLSSLGALLIGVGFLVVAFRRSDAELFGDSWGEGAIFVTIAIPCILLLGAGLTSPRGGEAAPWQTVCVVFGLILLPLALALFVDWIAGPSDAGNPLNVAWIFALTAVVSFYAGIFGRVRYALLLGAVALVISWLGLWGQIVSGSLSDHVTTLRWLLLLAAAGLVALALFAQGRASEVVTVAVLAAVGAGAISGLAVYGQNPFVSVPHANASFLWSLELLVVSLAAILYGAGGRARGPAYAGTLGLALFTLIVGLDLANPDSPSGTLLGWPLVLVIAGIAAFAASFAPSRHRHPGP
jgi:hypothetical protein